MSWLYRFSLLLLLVSCDVQDADSNLDRGYTSDFTVGNVRFQADEQLFRNLNFERGTGAFCASQVSIQSIGRDGDLLKVGLKKNAGCSGIYHLVWDGMVQESNPERVQLYLYTEMNGCTDSGVTVNDTITVDLKSAFASLEPAVVDRMSLYLREYCNLQDYLCEGDCDLKRN